MTRDEAMHALRFSKLWTLETNKAASHLLDCLEALGVLKLDRPKTTKDRAVEALEAERIAAHYILGTLDRAGLKVVEK